MAAWCGWPDDLALREEARPSVTPSSCRKAARKGTCWEGDTQGAPSRGLLMELAGALGGAALKAMLEGEAIQPWRAGPARLS